MRFWMPMALMVRLRGSLQRTSGSPISQMTPSSRTHVRSDWFRVRRIRWLTQMIEVWLTDDISRKWRIGMPESQINTR